MAAAAPVEVGIWLVAAARARRETLGRVFRRRDDPVGDQDFPGTAAGVELHGQGDQVEEDRRGEEDHPHQGQGGAEAAQEHAQITGDQDLARHFFNSVAILA